MAERHSGPDDLMTPAQVAEYLQLHKLTIYKYIREGRLPAARLGRSLRIARADVERFLEEHRESPVASGPRGRSPRAEQRAQESRVSNPPAPAQPGQEASSLAQDRDPRMRLEERLREAMTSSNPLDWVIRGLH